ncbi:ABC transporter permease [Lysinibacillus alkalisoli]|uniref:ABC transporter permease n=1 Tax=Lysinibacillus alkalisoli TaxID=1911548 RepID=A0A917LJM3_9BACI|nr:methionine ABC transporter permease [Lysinibacillus alkalisoli]GGG31652.1 ABC transporter permease [Lysinibacillus alkalisoli]
MLLDMAGEFQTALWETAWMLGIATLFSIIIGVPLGIFLFATSKGMFWQNKMIQSLAGTIINIFRSLPYMILLILLIPLTKWLLGTTTGPTAASISLTIAGIPFYARLVETALREIDRGVIEAAEACGASSWLIIKEVLIPEAKSGMIAGLTITMISLLGYSAMAGMIGGGGLGDLAIRFGYHRFQTEVMIATVIILIILVQLIQWLGDRLAKRAKKVAQS